MLLLFVLLMVSKSIRARSTYCRQLNILYKFTAALSFLLHGSIGKLQYTSESVGRLR